MAEGKDWTDHDPMRFAISRVLDSFNESDLLHHEKITAVIEAVQRTAPLAAAPASPSPDMRRLDALANAADAYESEADSTILVRLPGSLFIDVGHLRAIRALTALLDRTQGEKP